MNLAGNKALPLSICLALSFVRGLSLNYTMDESTLDTVIDFLFVGVYLHFCKQWFLADAHEHGLRFQTARERSKFGTKSFLFPFYFRQTRGTLAWWANLLAFGFLALTFVVVLTGGLLGSLFIGP